MSYYKVNNKVDIGKDPKNVGRDLEDIETSNEGISNSQN